MTDTFFRSSGSSPGPRKRSKASFSPSDSPDSFFQKSGSSPGRLSTESLIDPSQILTLDEIAARLKTSKRWVYEKSRRRCLDPLPTIRIGRYLRFNWVDVSAWLRKNSNVRSAA